VTGVKHGLNLQVGLSPICVTDFEARTYQLTTIAALDVQIDDIGVNVMVVTPYGLTIPQA
jgi:hypothetical protein